MNLLAHPVLLHLCTYRWREGKLVVDTELLRLCTQLLKSVASILPVDVVLIWRHIAVETEINMNHLESKIRVIIN